MNNEMAISAAEEEKRKKGKMLDPNLWIIPFSDFMTIMMIFFLALYVLSLKGNTVKNELLLLNIQEKLGSDVEQRKKVLEAAGSIEDTFADRGLHKLFNIEVNAQKIKIIMAAPILFSSGSAELNENAFPLMDELGRILAKIPNKVAVEGHTDDQPVSKSCKYSSNLALSGARAFNVIRCLIERGNLNPERFVALGCADNIPMKPNDSRYNRALNRRVELTIEK